ncbi:hypothetical protein VB620_06345 [Nodularia harveyana UHCC-0300]|uniref:Uncharacterized protein n=1 Tax=Nodularia harveyana UHCC-0300 TaxID=2974287 RepID=A0ABU5UCT5_9CYAN|nr:hypothetical protein [Nodularia harveyana]MEA5580959.1 hypothetical protein [Nodularia harveyana UHCC-0300]
MPNSSNSGLSVNLMLSQSAISAMAALVGSSFLVVVVVATPNIQIQKVNQNCTVGQPITTSVSKPMPLTRKD